MTIELIPAERFTMQELTDLYNQTRVDYMVPMPMNASRLGEYVHDFDIDLSQSCVARAADGQMLGLCMLGVRQNEAWITRLGVLPATRRSGVGSALMDCMMENASKLGAKTTQLEVIKNNLPAYNLFLCKDFKETGEYLVMRRAPHPASEPPRGNVDWLDSEKALEAIQAYPNHLTWINASESMRNAQDVEGLRLTLPDGGAGWLVYRNTKFTLRSTLSHLIIHTEQGNPIEVGTQLLLNLHTRYAHHDTYAENIHKDDPHLSAFHALGYFENFSRIEMLHSS
ncbi:MAG: GNAT family N-acetyltransferase [Anaerolineae bacterium]|nr:GNAT family N-acetyltransferase [Anaerolineae bacterium]MCI0609301.1 GNAT family N-acetyltransferase [Anaerolineae bacterium]